MKNHGWNKKQKTALGKKKVQIHDTENLYILQHLSFISKSFSCALVIKKGVRQEELLNT